MSYRSSLLFFLLSFGPYAIANFVGNDTQNFNPTTSGLDFLTVQGSQTLGPGIFNLGLFYNSAENSLPTIMDDAGQKWDSNDTIQFLDVGIGYGFHKDWGMGVSFSYLLDQDTNRTASGAQFADTGLNEIRINVKYTVLDRSRVGLALVPSVNFNQSRNNPFSGRNSGPTVNLEGVVDYQWSQVLMAFNLGYRVRDEGTPIENAAYEPLPDQIIASLGMSYYITRWDAKVIGEIYAAKPMKSVAYVNADETSAEFMLGLKHDVRDWVAVQWGGGGRLSEGLFTPDWRVYTGLNFTIDTSSRKPATPVEESPPPPVINEIKQVQQVHVYKGYQPGDIEKLKNVPFDEIAKRHEFQLRTTVPKANSKNPKPPFEIVRLDNFDFDFGSSNVRSEYHPMLNELGDYLAAEPGVLKVRVEGHTDSIGSQERNRSRSQSRAEAIRDYLKNRPGLKELPLEAAGYGADRPIADNGNFQGRKKNRRVEIRVLRRIEATPERIE